MATQLDPCPFQKEGETHDLRLLDELGDAWVLCSCGAAGPMFSGPDRKERATAHWNGRYERTCMLVKTPDVTRHGMWYGESIRCSSCGNPIKADLATRWSGIQYCYRCGARVLNKRAGRYGDSGLLIPPVETVVSGHDAGDRSG